MMSYVEDLLELGEFGFPYCFSDRYYLSFLIAHQLDLIEDESDSGNELNQKLNEIWDSKYKEEYHNPYIDSWLYIPYYRDDIVEDDKMPNNWYCFMMEKAPSVDLANPIEIDKGIIYHAKLKIIVLQYYNDLSYDFNNKTTPLNEIVYKNIEQQIEDWKNWLKVLED